MPIFIFLVLPFWSDPRAKRRRFSGKKKDSARWPLELVKQRSDIVFFVYIPWLPVFVSVSTCLQRQIQFFG